MLMGAPDGSFLWPDVNKGLAREHTTILKFYVVRRHFIHSTSDHVVILPAFLGWQSTQEIVALIADCAQISSPACVERK
jgi:hypothetical protein